MDVREERLHQLFLLNICLQVFDGVATYQGLLWHWDEGNPLLVATMPYLGVGPTLALFKAKACAFLLLLRRLGNRPLVHESLIVLAILYTMLSFVPWLTRIVSLLRL
jgi:hypothetical protein